MKIKKYFIIIHHLKIKINLMQEYNESNIKIFFRNFCDCLLENDNKLKEERIKLNSLFCFSNSYGYFNYLDKNKKNYIDFSDLALFLSINNIKFTKPLLNNIFKKYDKDGDSSWNFSEYLNFINNNINTRCNINSYNLCKTESNIQNYEKQLAKLLELEMKYIKYIGIKIKALKELINDKVINTKKIFNLIKKNKDKTNIDANALKLFLEDNFYHIEKENANKLILIMSNGKNSLSEKQLDNIFKYDKYLDESELIYPKYYWDYNYKSISPFNKYDEFPLNDFGVTYNSVNKIMNKNQIKDNNF